MAWAKLDDGFADHPKVIEAGPLASWLFVCGLTYCARQLTDGFIPAGQIRKLADVDNAKDLAQTLVTVGLWEECDGGYMIHDYLDYNPSRERVLATREVRADAGSRGGKTRAANAATISMEEAPPESKQNASKLLDVCQPFASENLKQNPTPSRTRPVPVSPPVKIPDPNENALSAAPPPESVRLIVPEMTEEDRTFAAFWTLYPKGRGSKKLSRDEWHKLKPPEWQAILAVLPAFVACHKWQEEGGRFVRHAERWLKTRGWEDDVPAPPPRKPNFHDAGVMLEQFKEQRNGRAEDAGVRGAGKTWGPWGYLDDDPPALLDQVEGGVRERRDGQHGADGRDVGKGAQGPIEARYRVGSG